jgi:hypothetical protein
LLPAFLSAARARFAASGAYLAARERMLDRCDFEPAWPLSLMVLMADLRSKIGKEPFLQPFRVPCFFRAAAVTFPFHVLSVIFYPFIR